MYDGTLKKKKEKTAAQRYRESYIFTIALPAYRVRVSRKQLKLLITRDEEYRWPFGDACDERKDYFYGSSEHRLDCRDPKGIRRHDDAELGIDVIRDLFSMTQLGSLAEDI